MKNENLIRVAAAWCVLAGAGLACGQFAIPWSTIDNGGASVSNGAFRVRGTVGQPDAAAARANGQFSNTGGYWAPPPPSCVGDLNTDGVVNTGDLTMFLGRFGNAAAPGSPEAIADFNADGIVNTADLTVFLGRFGSFCF
ncbi:MAG: hypothetical protein J0L61_05570 [Planctomycetes bacterium]|nr:hypothetical protein [Planctomycetota bacterium]